MRTIKKNGVRVHIITDQNEAWEVLDRLDGSAAPIALDFETTALRPDDSDDAKVRITSLCQRAGEVFVLDHFYCGEFEMFCDALLELGPYYVANVNFEGRWFEYCVDDVTALSRKLLDIFHMRRSVMGGGPLGLATMAKMDLKLVLDKEEQRSDWSAPKLRLAQYFYAGYDAHVTLLLADKWAAEMSTEHWNGFYIINEAWRAVNECTDTGLLIDVAPHTKLIKMWEKRKNAAEKAFRKFVPKDALENIQSKKQISDWLKTVLDDDGITGWPKTEKTQQLQTTRPILRSMSFIAPYPFSRVLAALMVYSRATKYLSTYGETLQTIQSLSADGRIHSRLNMAQAATGRFSSSGPNQQNFPRHPAFRNVFIAGEGCKMILADYSGVEIRVLAELSGDKVLLHDAIYDDVHARSAIAIYSLDEAEFLAALKRKDPRAKEMRSKAKGFTFQLLYGAGAAALAIVLRCSVDEAQEAINKWAARYSKAYHYRTYMFEKMNSTGFLPVHSGRTIYVSRQDRSMPVAANYPVQGAAADVIYEAMRHVQLVLEEAGIDATLLASVHDELLLLSDEWCAELAGEALKEGMTKGWLSVFPDSNIDNLVDVVVGDRWSDKA